MTTLAKFVFMEEPWNNWGCALTTGLRNSLYRKPIVRFVALAEPTVWFCECCCGVGLPPQAYYRIPVMDVYCLATGSTGHFQRWQHGTSSNWKKKTWGRRSESGISLIFTAPCQRRPRQSCLPAGIREWRRGGVRWCYPGSDQRRQQRRPLRSGPRPLTWLHSQIAYRRPAPCHCRRGADKARPIV